MNNMELNLYLKYPSLTRMNSKKTEFRGIIEHNSDKCAFVVFHVPNYPQAKDIEYETRKHLTEDEKKLLQSESENLNFFEFLELFKRFIFARPNVELFNSNRFQTFCNEFVSLKSLYPNHKFVLNNNITVVKIIYTDSNAFHHDIHVNVDFYNKYEPLYQIKEHSFPEANKKDLFSSEKSLKHVHKKFVNYAEELKPFYDTINKIDCFCWVLDPIKPTTKNTYRRIVIEEGVSMQITFDPWDPKTHPKIQFFGPARLVDRFLHNVDENMENWDSEYDIIQSILRLLDLPFFPIKPEEDSDEIENLLVNKEECCICFSLHLNDKSPEIICDNPSCEKYFHTECLYEWLWTISPFIHKKVAFDMIHGECPNCEKRISCKKPEA